MPEGALIRGREYNELVDLMLGNTVTVGPGLNARRSSSGTIISLIGSSGSDSRGYFVCVGKITASTPGQNGSGWIYTIQRVRKGTQGFGGWNADENTVLAHNLADEAGTSTQPAPNGLLVPVFLVHSEGASEYWFFWGEGLDAGGTVLVLDRSNPTTTWNRETDLRPVRYDGPWLEYNSTSHKLVSHYRACEYDRGGNLRTIGAELTEDVLEFRTCSN